jgi:hypothetical protein
MVATRCLLLQKRFTQLHILPTPYNDLQGEGYRQDSLRKLLDRPYPEPAGRIQDSALKG